jgi:regulator of sigma E protease
VEGSPAQAAGVLPGDRLIGVGTHVVQSFIELRDAVQRSGEQHGKVNLVWERSGKVMQAEIVPTATNSRDPNLKKTTQFTVGVVPQLVWAEAETLVEHVYNPITLVATATQRMWQHSERNLVSIVKMVKGEVSVKALGGPILIGKVAGESLSRGLIAFLTTMSVLSVGLGVLNLLPVPVLDGGHIVLLGIEAILRRPLSVRFVEVVQQVGFALILLLMVVVMRNDISRLPIFGN